MLQLNRLYQFSQGRLSLGFQWIANVSVSDAVIRPYIQGTDYAYDSETGTLAWIENSRFNLPSGWLEVVTDDNVQLITFPDNGRLILSDKPPSLTLRPIDPIQYQSGVDYLVNHDKGLVVLAPTTRIPQGATVRTSFIAGGKSKKLSGAFAIGQPLKLEAPIHETTLTVTEGTYLEGLDYLVESDAGIINILEGSRLVGSDVFITYESLSGMMLSTSRTVTDSIISIDERPLKNVTIKAINLELIEDIGEQVGDYQIDYQTGAVTFKGRTPRTGLIAAYWNQIQSATYATPGDFSNIFEPKETLEITNLGNPEATYPNYQKLWEALEYASSEVDFRINNYNRLPLQNVPPGIEWKTVVLARAFCDTARVREGVQRDLELVMQQLKELAEGGMSVPDLEGPTSPGARGAYRPGALDFTRQKLRGW